MRNSTQCIRKQSGMSFTGVAIILIVSGFFLMLAFKLFPVYTEHTTAKAMIEGLGEEVSRERLSTKAIKTMLLKRMQVNNIEGITPDDIRIKRKGRGYTVKLSYEVRKHIMYNASIVLTFDDTFVWSAEE